MVYSKVLACLHVGSPSFPHDLITFIYRVVFEPIFCSWHIFFFVLFIVYFYIFLFLFSFFIFSAFIIPSTFLTYPAGPSTARSEAFWSDNSLHVCGRRFMSVSCVHFCACMCVCACVCLLCTVTLSLLCVREPSEREREREVGELLSCLFSGAILTATSAALGYDRGEIC
jgi:hypothetical protein